MQTGSRISPGKIRFPPIFLLENRSVIIHSFPRARTPIRKPIGKVHRRLQHMHTYAQVLVRYTWSGVPKLALPLDRVQNQRTCYFCNLFTLGYRSDGRVAGGTQADAIYGRVEKREEGKGGNPCSIFQLRSDRSPFEIAVSEFSEQNFSIPSCGIVCYLNFLYYIQVLGYVVCREEIGEGKRGDF